MATSGLAPLALRIAIATIAATAAAQPPAASLRIASPGEGAYVEGPTRLVAVVEPPAAASDVEEVTFFADGRKVCTIRRPPFECDWDAGVRVVEQQIRAVAILKSGASLVKTVRTADLPGYTERVDVDVVLVTVAVADRRGRFVRGLKQGDFAVFEDGKRQSITYFASENIPLEMVLALDMSSSMNDSMPTVKASAKRFLAGRQASDQITVLAFNENVLMPARRTTDQAALDRAIDSLDSWGGTALYDAIIRAVDLLGRQTGRRSILLFSDGDDKSSHATLDAGIAKTESSDATIYAIGQGRAVSSPHLRSLLERLAEVSGGRAFSTENPTELDGIFETILDELRNQYLIGYPAPDGDRDKWHDIDVQVAGEGYKVRARKGIGPKPSRGTPRR
ncbi:MAG TPA: VWA domain-containing protein [Vicinamibacterales bacterium]|nr:VWA domain-containing protein [Vicinamibacterales bacterium]